MLDFFYPIESYYTFFGYLPSTEKKRMVCYAFLPFSRINENGPAWLPIRAHSIDLTEGEREEEFDGFENDFSCMSSKKNSIYILGK